MFSQFTPTVELKMNSKIHDFDSVNTQENETNSLESSVEGKDKSQSPLMHVRQKPQQKTKLESTRNSIVTPVMIKPASIIRSP